MDNQNLYTTSPVLFFIKTFFLELRVFRTLAGMGSSSVGEFTTVVSFLGFQPMADSRDKLAARGEETRCYDGFVVSDITMSEGAGLIFSA